MAQPSVSSTKQPPSSANLPTGASFLRKLFGRSNPPPASVGPPQLKKPEPEPDTDDPQNAGLGRRVSRKVVPGLPRVQTFKRQQSERRNNLAPVEPSPAERRALSVDRRVQPSRAASQAHPFPRASAPDFFENASSIIQSGPSVPVSPVGEKPEGSLVQRAARVAEPVADEFPVPDELSQSDAHSVTTSQSQYEARICDELENIWILNLSMHFRDKSKREKFFVTYRETPTLWRRVTISLDYRNAPDNSLEMDLLHAKSQRDKSSKIYEAIRDSLQDIQFYPSVTNLKLQTTDGRLHVHVVEDVNEIIPYPTVRQVQHLGCRRIKEGDIDFDSHMSGFVYKVCIGGEILIKKEIPGPDTIDEFLYEINALDRLQYSRNIIRFYGVVVDDDDEHVKGLLISYAVHGALIDVIYDKRQESEGGLPWSVREKWALQIVQGLADIHESGFVQGDFTLSNIVVDYNDDAKIIDINRRGCPVGWEPPEATPLIESNQRISMYIGVKSDLYQLGMVLWALAAQDDEPEAQRRPLQLGEECVVPAWYRQIVDICLSEDPRLRLQASSLMALFPEHAVGEDIAPRSISVDDGYSMQEYFVDSYQPNSQVVVRTVQPSQDWSYVNTANTYRNPTGAFSQGPYSYTRGRSPPSPLLSHYGRGDSPGMGRTISGWAGAKNIAPSYSDAGVDEIEEPNSATPTTSKDSVTTPEPMEEARKAAQQKLEQLQLTPLSHDLVPLDEVEVGQNLVQEDSKVVGEEFAKVLVSQQPADTCTLADPIETRPAMASPMTVLNVATGQEEVEQEEMGANTAERNKEQIPEEQETQGPAPTETGITEPKGHINIEDVAKKSPADQLVVDVSTTAGAESESKPKTTEELQTKTVPGAADLLTEPLAGDGLSETHDRIGQPASAPVTQNGPNGSLAVGAPELKGIGGMYLDTDELARREKLSLDDFTTTMTTTTTTTMTAATASTDSHE